MKRVYRVTGIGDLKTLNIRIMRRLEAILVILIIFSAYTFAQKISGVVYFVDEPVKNAKVINDDNGEKVKTDVNGYFEINAKSDALLNVSYKGTEATAKLNGVDFYTDIVLLPGEKKFIKLIEKDPSIKKCELYLAAYPEGAKKNFVTVALEKQIFISAYDEAVADFKLDKLQMYLEKYPEGKYASKAERTIDIVSWQKAKSQDTIEAYNAYLEEFPNGEAVSLAKQKMAMLGE